MNLNIPNKTFVVHPLLYMLVILGICSIPDPVDIFYIGPKAMDLLHIPMFGILAFLWMRAFFYNKLDKGNAILYTLTICVIYGVVTEFYQALIPGRYTSVADMAFNLVGSTLGAFIYRYKR
jgi:VanZ family protein